MPILDAYVNVNSTHLLFTDVITKGQIPILQLCAWALIAFMNFSSDFI
jgi:hypothetical protein